MQHKCITVVIHIYSKRIDRAGWIRETKKLGTISDNTHITKVAALIARYVLAINAATLVICVLSLIVPSFLVSRIHPARSIRFE